MNKKTKRSITWIPQKKNQKDIGIHLIAEFWGSKIIEDSKKIEEILVGAAIVAKSTPLKVAIHKFSTQGITGVVLLAESHIALHSWPEMDYLAIDIFTCGEKTMPEKSLSHLKKAFQPKKITFKKIKRGET